MTAGPPGARSDFERAVAAAIRAIPRGETRSYGGIALRAGKPRGARAVVQALRRLHDVPWWRVIRSDGTIAAEVATEQAPRLRAEGVRVVGRRVIGRRDQASTPRRGPARKRDEVSTAGGGPARKRNEASRQARPGAGSGARRVPG